MPNNYDYEYDDLEFEEDWHDDHEEDCGDDLGSESVPCPECHQPIPEFLDLCPACGYWLSESDRRRLDHPASKPKWVLFTAVVMIAVLFFTIPGIWRLFFG